MDYNDSLFVYYNMSDGCIRFFMEDYPTMPQIEYTVDETQSVDSTVVDSHPTSMSWEDTIELVMSNMGR